MESDRTTLRLSDAHMAAAGKPRYLSLSCDAFGFFSHNRVCPGLTDIAELIRLNFDIPDRCPNKIDTIWWDIFLSGDDRSVYPSRLLPRRREGMYQIWADQGVDVWQELIRAGEVRGIENMLIFRISECCFEDLWSEESANEPLVRLRNAHPEWFIKCWHPQGMWNIADPAVQKRKLDILKECIENYAFGGVEIDFCRHTPFLEPGKQWELRDTVTAFLRAIREMLLAHETDGRTLLLSARVPDCVEGCHADGLDVETWAKEGIIDALTLGARSLDVDIEGFRQAVGERVRLYPCYDQHHTSDAYAMPDDDTLRGIFSAHLHRGADGIRLFNWLCSTAETARRCLGDDFPFFYLTEQSERTFRMLSDPKTVLHGDKTFVIERRGGYPWEEGYANNNNCKPLPLPLSNREQPAEITFYVSDDLSACAGMCDVTLSLVLYGMLPTDTLQVTLGGIPLCEAARDVHWRDDEINAPGQPYIAGYILPKLPSKENRPLTKLTCTVAPGTLTVGKNPVTITVFRKNYPNCSIVTVEKAELHIAYR